MSKHKKNEIEQFKKQKETNLQQNTVTQAQGITLIALVISIIVMLILAGVSINAIVGENGVLTNAQNATLSSKFASWKEELALNVVEDETVTCAKENMRKYIHSIEDEYLEKFVIANSKLQYIGNDKLEKKVCDNIGIGTEVGDTGAVADIIEIYDKILSIDTEKTPKLPGEVLYSKDGAHLDNWNLIITYDSMENEQNRFGTGYYFLKAGTYTIDSEPINLTQDYVINYDTKFLIGLGNYKKWNLESTLAVNDGLVLNVDPSNLATGRWVADSREEGFEYFEDNGENTGILKTGDVVYDGANKALKFNESSENTAGEGGYIKLIRNGVDFSNGFSFEMYANLSRLRYNNNSISPACSGLFSRMPSLNSSVTQSMRFGFLESGMICKFNNNSSWQGNGNGLKTGDGIYSLSKNDAGYDINEDFYLTFVYIVYDAEKSAKYKEKYLEEYNSKEGNYDSYMDEKGVDKILYYVNGELFGYTYYGHDSYIKGCETWNTDECPFFVGVCPWRIDGNSYYLKGLVYTCRLYQTSMTPSQVKDNMSATKQYRSSF